MKMTRKLALLTILAVLAVCLSSCGNQEQDNYESRYQQAEALIAEGKYAEAAKELEGFGSYKEATLLSMYCRAVEAAESEDYTTAFTTFTYLGGYRDSSLMAAYYTARQHLVFAEDGQHEPVEEYLLAAEGFLGIPHFRDSLKRADDAYRSAYEFAVGLAEAGEFERAIQAFELLGEYRDSAILAKKAKADQLYEQEDLAGAYEIYRTLDVSYQTHAADYLAKYNLAVSMMDEGKYDDAARAFEALGEYEDSPGKRVECLYQYAKGMIRQKQYRDAIAILNSLAGYSDSQTLAAMASADSLFDSGDLAGAWEIYGSLADPYRTHDQDYAQRYEEAEKLLAAKDYREAREGYLALGGYQDSASMAVRCRLEEAEDLAGQGKYPDAIRIFRELGEADRVKECCYQYAAQLLAEKDYVSAAEQFLLCKGYRDSDEMHFRAGTAAADAGMLREAYLILKEDPNTEAAREQIYRIAKEASAQQDYALSTEAYGFVGAWQEAILERLEDYYRWGNSLYEQGDYNSSMEVFAALGDFSNAPEKIRRAGYTAAVEKMAQGDYASAKVYLSALGSYRDSGELLRKCEYELAAEIYRNGKYQEALDAFSAHSLAGFEQADEMIADCHYHLGLNAEAEARYPEAIGEYRACGGLGDSEERILECSYQYALLLKEQGDVNGALEWLVNARRHPSAIGQIERIIQFLETTEMTEEAEHVRQVLLMVRGENAMDAGEYETAISFYQQVTDRSVSKDREAEAYYLLGEERMKEGNYPEAADCFAAAKGWPGADEKRREAWLEAGQERLAGGDYAGAREAFRLAENEDMVIAAWNAEGEAYLAEGRYAEARSAFAEAGNTERITAAWNAEGEACLADGRFAEARSAFAEAGNTESIIAAWNAEGEAYLAEGQFEDAKSAFAEAGNQARQDDATFMQAQQLLEAGEYKASFDLLNTIRQYPGVQELIRGNPELKKWEIQVGSIVLFGHYEQDGNSENGPEAIEWIVLDIQEDHVLLLSRYGLDHQQYHTSNNGTPWSNSHIRRWLNKEFYLQAFSPEEQSFILITDVDNSAAQGYSGWEAIEEENTRDRVFLLSYAEAEKYLGLPSGPSARVAPTAYAAKRGALTSNNYKTNEGTPAGWWWLRSPGGSLNRAAFVSCAGSIDQMNIFTIKGSIRPAIWIDYWSITWN